MGVPRETFPGETRVAMTPAAAVPLVQAGFELVVETGAGERAGFPDEAYAEKGATAGSRGDAFGADVVLQVRTYGANPKTGREDLELLRSGQGLMGFANPLGAPEAARDLAPTGVTSFSIELMPRITRAQSMDALSSQATVGGYRAVLLAAESMPKMFPMLTTAAGTIAPARVLVIGAGVAGLQAIATARRLGAVVEAYDVRPAVKEQVQSLGAKFVELELETDEAEAAGGYAKEMDEEFLRKQRELMARVVAGSDAVITTAQVQGKRAPVIVTAEMVRGMQPGAVIVDMAAEQGGNCELSKPDEEVLEHGVRIFGPTNLPAEAPFHASQMYAKNLANFVLHVFRDGAEPNLEDEIVDGTLVTRGGNVVCTRVLEALGGLEPGGQAPGRSAEATA
ncbi:MAG: Re/Si-specific NAD(P)(+) transhydrogenase subunit alpha [Actinomycetota bacterium]